MRLRKFLALTCILAQALSASEVVQVAWNADLESVQALVKAKPTAANEYSTEGGPLEGHTPLLAVIQGNAYVVGKSEAEFAKQLANRILIVKFLIEQKCDIKLPYIKTQSTPLHFAARLSMKDAAQLLLDAGADVQARDFKGMTPFLVSVRARTPEVTELLLARKSDINAESRDGWNALTLASIAPSASMVEFLLSKKLDPNKPGGPEKLTPLQCAIKQEWMETPEIIKLLLDAGANPQVKNAEGKVITVSATPLFNKRAMELALRDADFPKFKAAIEADAELLNSEFQRRPLLWALAMNLYSTREKADATIKDHHSFGLEALKFLLEKKADPNKATYEGFTALHMAAGAGRLDAVELLVRAGANVNAVARKESGMTPIFSAALEDKTDVVEYLLNQKAETTYQGYPLLGAVAANGKPEMVRFLLSKKLNPNEAGGPKKQSPLHMAAQSRLEDRTKINESIKILLEAGADPKIKDADGRTYAEYDKARASGVDLPPNLVGKWYPKMDPVLILKPFRLRDTLTNAETAKAVAAFSALLASETYEFSEDGSFKYELNVPKTLLPQLLDVAALGVSPATSEALKKEFTDMCANSPQSARGKWKAQGSAVEFDFTPRPDLKVDGSVTLKNQRLSLSGFRDGCWLEPKK